ncbi:hypothetical protein BJ138DRAFT_921315 [Hygrophoropsis aurantiaca]|uniref:Uncharacterized protein n=1 Tax=Hygrophoropsis aurantiaca TaxID=72124 RepID=A0ACB8AEE6_9AGAM|nr:hypothetical protein BJ138DRAFT_921315 [Hygrophoropsis aurantiaca]
MQAETCGETSPPCYFPDGPESIWRAMLILLPVTSASLGALTVVSPIIFQDPALGFARSVSLLTETSLKKSRTSRVDTKLPAVVSVKYCVILVAYWKGDSLVDRPCLCVHTKLKNLELSPTPIFLSVILVQFGLGAMEHSGSPHVRCTTIQIADLLIDVHSVIGCDGTPKSAPLVWGTAEV